MRLTEFLQQTRQRAIREKRNERNQQLKYIQGQHAARLAQQVRLLNFLSENPAAAPPSGTAQLLGEIREEVDYTVAHYALKQGYRADDLSESMKSDFYDRAYVEHPELVDAIVSRAHSAHKQPTQKHDQLIL
ncbi:MAG TPA: hypothetical protein V6D19_19060 [Stenomitos sp.]